MMKSVFLGIFSAAVLIAGPVSARIITVGVSGLGANCSWPTIQQAINEAALTPNERHSIWITRDTPNNDKGWANLNLNIHNLNILIVGGFDDCEDGEPSGVSILDGGVGPAAPVINITGDSIVEIRNVHVRRSNADNGIEFAGRGTLQLIDSIVSDVDGAGVRLLAQGGPASLFVENSHISRNFDWGILAAGNGSQQPATVRIRSGSWLTHNGTGAHVLSNALLIQEYGSSIESNLRGSGIYVTGGEAQISGFVQHNRGTEGAGDGAGIKVEYNQSIGGGKVRIVNASIGSNIANGVGGGIYATSVNGIPTEPLVCMRDVVLTGNQARGGSGGAMWIAGKGVRAEWNTECIPADATPCPFGVCNVMSGNATRPSDGAFTDGPTVRIGRGATAHFRELLIEGNTGTALFAMDSPVFGLEQGNLHLDTSIVRENFVGVDSIFWASRFTHRNRVTNSTILNNHVTQGGVVFSNASVNPFYVENTLVAQPGVPIALPKTQVFSIGAALAWPGTVGPEHQMWFTQAIPVFDDAYGRLHWSSPGVDAGGCAVVAPTFTDYDGLPRNTDVPGVGDDAGQPDACLRDIGAFEALPAASDVIFEHGFEFLP